MTQYRRGNSGLTALKDVIFQVPQIRDVIAGSCGNIAKLNEDQHLTLRRSEFLGKRRHQPLDQRRITNAKL